jgi:hypothetical protein
MQDLKGMPRRSLQYKEARRNIRKEKHGLRRCLKQKIRNEWTDKQAVDDIERQLHGDGFAKDAVADTPSSTQRPAQKRLVETLTTLVDTTPEGDNR